MDDIRNYVFDMYRRVSNNQYSLYKHTELSSPFDIADDRC